MTDKEKQSLKNLLEWAGLRLTEAQVLELKFPHELQVKRMIEEREDVVTRIKQELGQ